MFTRDLFLALRAERFWAIAVSVIAVPSFAIGAEGAGEIQQTVAIVASDYKNAIGKQWPIDVRLKGGELSRIRFQNKEIPLRNVDERGSVLWTVQSFGKEFVVFKLRRGWPSNSSAKEMDPTMDSLKSQLDGSGGYLTLSYLAEGGVFGNEYKHLKLLVKCEASGGCRLRDEDGKPFDRLFAFAKENQRGLKSVEPVTRSRYAELTHDHVVGVEFPAVASNPMKRFADDSLAMISSSSQNERESGRFREVFAGIPK